MISLPPNDERLKTLLNRLESDELISEHDLDCLIDHYNTLVMQLAPHVEYYVVWDNCKQHLNLLLDMKTARVENKNDLTKLLTRHA
jgi:ribosome assembly protein YihI (activator of Der GTPase)